MSAANVLTRGWMSEQDMREMGFQRTRPEIDYGMRWGDDYDVRVSFAPYDDTRTGFLYAYRKSTERFLLLATCTTHEQVQAAWRDLNGCTTSPDGYLAFAALDSVRAPMPMERARQLLIHCVEQEIMAHQEFSAAPADEPARFDAAYNVVVQRSARVAAEELHLEAARVAASDGAAVVVRYRVLDEPRWTGRVSGDCLESAAHDAKRIHEIGQRHGLVIQATSVSQRHATVSAARVPALISMSHPAHIPSGAPRLDI